VAAVVTISGSGPQDRDEWVPIVPGYRPYRQLADTLSRRGMAVLRFDDRGHGGSTGNHSTATSADFAHDVRAVVAWLRERADIDPDRVFLLGHSEGAIIAPLVAARDSALAAIVLLAGPSKSGREIIYEQQRYAIDRDPALETAHARDSAALAARLAYDSFPSVNPWNRFFAAYDPLPTARTVHVPTLILHGDSDRQVTVDQAETLAGAMREAGNRDVTVRVYEGLNHLFLRDPEGNPANYGRLSGGGFAPEVVGTIVDWLLARTR
jgi:alpha-beta hydrolase superfamily lysophospholipase